MNILRLHPKDSVAVALRPLAAGESLDGLDVTPLTDIPSGHKVALQALAAGEVVRKYNQVIGIASVAIAAGEHIHVHNLQVGTVAAAAAESVEAFSGSTEAASFEGIVRADGRIATRNYIGIIATVNCSGTVAKAIAGRLSEELRRDYPGIDGIVALTHGSGCAMDSEGLEILQRTLLGMMKHVNFSHVLVLGLGCETNQIETLLASGGLSVGPRLQTLMIQDSGGSIEAVDKGEAIIRSWLPEAAAIERQAVPASHLVLGLQCGGSDGFSGITANPALGVACDLLVAQGATVVLSETPEIFGAEHLLTSRAASPQVAENLDQCIRWWQDYAARQGASLDNNPSPGNKAGGLTTILEKSLGAVAKAGSSPLQAVYRYAETITEPGLVFMDSPGFDPVSATGQLASGANMIAFTTGRGSVFGCKPSPCLKLATNSELYRRMAGDMDINCGDLLSGEMTLEQKGRLIFELILATASGAPSKSEALGMGDSEFVPWTPGMVL